MFQSVNLLAVSCLFLTVESRTGKAVHNVYLYSHVLMYITAFTFYRLPINFFKRIIQFCRELCCHNVSQY